MKPRAFSDDEAVGVIRAYLAGASMTDLSEAFGVTPKTISSVLYQEGAYSDLQVPEELAERLEQRKMPSGRFRRSDALLTEEEARSIFDLYATGEWRHEDLAERFGVCRSLITHVLAGRYSYKHIRDEVPDEILARCEEVASEAPANGTRERFRERAEQRLGRANLSVEDAGRMKGLIEALREAGVAHPNWAGIGEMFGTSRETPRLVASGSINKWIEPAPCRIEIVWEDDPPQEGKEAA